MKSKLINFLLIVSSLIGYLEWGGDQHSFLFQIEAEIISKLFVNPIEVLHPFTILPMMGQLFLFITLFQKKPNKILTYTGIGCLGILLGLMLVIGLMNLNYKILFSIAPFIVLAVLAIKHYRKINDHESGSSKPDH